jgi:[calcium/calmodulin-dependent protein kinase] kinase
MHGKVKLARNSENGEFVAIKIIPRFSKKRRLGKVMAMSTQDKSKREIAILKKIRHDNVVALLEIIDDPEMKKIYMVLEHVELGEVVWRKKGLPHICEYERRRVEREMRGEKPTPGEERFERLLEQRQALRDAERAKAKTQAQGVVADYWSLEYGPADGEESHHGSLGSDVSAFAGLSLSFRDSLAGSRATSRAPSRTQSTKSLSKSQGPHLADSNTTSTAHQDDFETPCSLTSNPNSSAALDGAMYGTYAEDPTLRGRSPSMADSIMSHMSSLDYARVRDPYVDDFSYVPCFTIKEARDTFRDTVLGLEYLHYEGVVHRDIKPANLLWTREKKTKIADFGVSYFGRPVRDGEPDDTISESEARDFDNDLELAKTVGTPAFFAPELCATDLHDAPPDMQPKINEQIDVWSLGVTLYCLIFARIPFLAEDEWQMFKKIANEDVFIPKRRLRPVDPATKPSEKSLYTRVNKPPYRDDDELAYEEIEWQLQDLLSKMLTKNPEKRIRLRDVKRHPWVTQGLDLVAGWLDDTDPSRRTSGRKIQVDEKDITQAVVPLSFIDRARSAVKKVVGKVMHPRGERTESVSSRRRAASSAASSAGDIPILSALITPHLRDARRKSLRPDDYFSSPSQPSAGHHPLTHSVLASPQDESPASPQQQPSTGGGPSFRQPLELLTSLPARDEHWTRQASASPHRMVPRHGHVRSLTNTFLSLTPTPIETQTLPPTPLFGSPMEDSISALRKARDTKPAADDPSRARSVDRGLFASNDKRAEAKVSLSTAVAPGNVHFPLTPGPRPTRSIEFAKRLERGASSAVPMSSSPLTGYQHGYFKSDPNMHNKQRVPVELEERPLTAHRVEDLGGARTRQHGSFNASTHEPPATPQRQLMDGACEPEPALIPCPPSPDDGIFRRMPMSRGERIATGKSSSSTSMGGLTTPLTSPSESASSIYGLNTHMTKEVTDQMLAFQSDPSLPALLSSTSSVSADPEGEFLGNPGLVGRSSVIDTTDSLTPPAFAKESMSGFPLDVQDAVRDGAVHVKLDARRRPLMGTMPLSRTQTHAHASHMDDDEDSDSDSDSDEGLVMAAKPKKKMTTTATATAAEMSRDAQVVGRLMGGVAVARRRDTNASVGSTETAKKLVVDSD